jgi:hypothetical protein
MIIWSMIYKGLFIIRLAVTFWAAKVIEVKNWRSFPRIVRIDDILVKMRQVWLEIHYCRNTNEQSWSWNRNLCWQSIGKTLISHFLLCPLIRQQSLINNIRQTKAFASGRVFVFPGSASLVSVDWKIPRTPN